MPASPKRVGARVEWYGQHMWIANKRREEEQAKEADRLELKST